MFRNKHIRTKKDRSTGRRRLAVQPLEDRRLLSISVGLPLALCETPTAPQFALVSTGIARATTTASRLVLAMPLSVQSGTPVTAELAAVNARGRLVTAYSGSVTLSSSDSSATLPSTITFTQGIARFQVTFATAGRQTLTAKDSSNTSLTTTASANVAAPAVATHFAVSLPANVKAGTAVTVQLTALDARNRPVASYSGKVALASSDTGATLPSSVTFTRGVATMQVTFATAGKQTLRITDTTNSSLTTTVSTTVTAPAVATRLGLSLPSSATAGTAVTVRLTALDAQNRVVTSYSGKVVLSSSDTGATLPSSVTFVQGVATFQVTFATAGAQTLTATDSANASLTATASTTVTSNTTPSNGFQISTIISGMTAAQQTIVQQAVARWQQIIVGDLPNVTYRGQAIDDLQISISAIRIDGSGGVLGQSAATAVRSGSDLPYLGFIQLDTADVAAMASDGSLLGVLEHEIAHVLGFGTIWDSLGLLSGARTSNPTFTGANATAEYNTIFKTSASGVPVEATGGSGTALSHWRESVFGSELMTGWYNSGQTNPLSRITVASFADLGYVVNLAAADAYTPTSATAVKSMSAVKTTSTFVMAAPSESNPATQTTTSTELAAATSTESSTTTSFATASIAQDAPITRFHNEELRGATPHFAMSQWNAKQQHRAADAVLESFDSVTAELRVSV